MKTKSFEKKLSLNKNTISRLNGQMMNTVRGGEETENDLCETFLPCEATNEFVTCEIEHCY